MAVELFSALLLAHLAGVIIAVGGATVSDALFFKTIRNRHVSRDEYKLLKEAGKVIWSGFALAVLTGIGFILYQFFTSESIGYFQHSYFWAKMAIVFIIAVNGVIFHKKVLPFMSEHLDEDMTEEEFTSRFWLFSLTGAISIVSWWTVVVLAVLNPTLPLLFILNIYVLIVAFATLFGYLMITHTIFGDQEISGTFSSIPRGLILGVLGVLIVGLVAGGAYYYSTSAEREAETHTVCIQEEPPWFDDAVLKIEPGDTVTWEHCGAGGHEDITYTHPIESISGPESFSSGFGLIGREGMEFSHTFTEEGIYEYICPTHPYMEGKIAVGEKYHDEVEDIWPKESAIDDEDILEEPPVPGEGEIWVDTQFEEVEGQRFPGTITVIDGETWETEKTITHENFNNPHNLWNSYNEEYVFQTQWHDNKVSKIDVGTREVVSDKEVGNAPAHLFVHPQEDRLYITLNNEDRVVVTDLELNKLDEIETNFGAHGIWIDPGAEYMSVAATLGEKLDIIDLEEEEVVGSFDAPGFPLGTQIDHDGQYAMINLLLEGKVRFVDLETMEIEKDVDVGDAPIWAMPGPENEYVFVPNTGTADVSVIDIETLQVVETLPAGAGAHGISFAEKQGEEGYYGYVSNKYEHAVTVIDLEQMETIGHIELEESKIGGNGILTLPNPYNKVMQDG